MTERLARLLSWDAGVDGRWIAAGAVAAYLALLAVLGALTQLDPWRILGVPSGPFLFFDTHNLTSAAECLQGGQDPFAANPCDFHDRPWNYSTLWLAVAWLGVDDSWRLPLGLAQVAAFWGSAAWLVGRLTTGQGVILAAVAVSPAMMFAVEHGQADLLMFALAALAVVAWRAREPARAVSPLLLAVGGALKLFPAVGLGAYLLARHRRSALVAIGAGAALAVYVAVTLDDIRLMNERNPEGQIHSYGARLLLGALARDLLGGTAVGETTRRGVAVLGLAVVTAGVWLWTRRRSSLVVPPPGPVDWRLHGFHVGALIYLGTFAIASSWDYRLIFLLLCLPQLFAWVASAGSERRLAGWATAAVVVQCHLGAMVAYWALWRTLPETPLPTWAVADEVVSWLLAALLLALLAPSVRAPWQD